MEKESLNSQCAELFISEDRNICEAILSTTDEKQWKLLMHNAVKSENDSIKFLLIAVIEKRNLPCLKFILQDEYRGHLDINVKDVHGSSALQHDTTTLRNCIRLFRTREHVFG